MAFVNSLFPNPKLISDLQVEIGLPTTIVGSGSTEYRIQKFQQTKKKWVWPSRAMSTADRSTIQNFITDVAKFSLNSFLFLDPDTNYWTNVQLTSTGSGNTFFVTQRGGLDIHPIFHYGSDVIVKLAGTAVTPTFGIDANGLAIVTVPGATTSSVVTITGTYYFAARLDSATFSFALTALQGKGDGTRDSKPWHDTVADITLVEVFE